MKKSTRVMFLLSAVAAFLSMPTFAQESSSERVFEMRTYTAAPGRMEDLLNRFREHTTEFFEKHGMTNIGYWRPMDNQDDENTLIYLLAHESRDAAQASWQAFGEDEEWQRVAEESNANGRILLNVNSIYLTPTDFSALK